MMTTMTTTTNEELLGRELARIAFDLNEVGPPTYTKYVPAFAAAARVFASLSKFGQLPPAIDDLPDALWAAYDKEITRLLDEAGI